MITLGELISRKREKLGYGKIQFAKMIGIGDDSLRSWERNRYKPAGKHKKLVATLLEFTPSEIKEYFGVIYG
jgi:DNA-binding transcriptional regulator YiaG